LVWFKLCGVYIRNGEELIGFLVKWEDFYGICCLKQQFLIVFWVQNF